MCQPAGPPWTSDTAILLEYNNNNNKPIIINTFIELDAHENRILPLTTLVYLYNWPLIWFCCFDGPRFGVASMDDAIVAVDKTIALLFSDLYLVGRPNNLRKILAVDVDSRRRIGGTTVAADGTAAPTLAVAAVASGVRLLLFGDVR